MRVPEHEASFFQNYGYVSDGLHLENVTTARDVLSRRHASRVSETVEGRYKPGHDFTIWSLLFIDQIEETKGRDPRGEELNKDDAYRTQFRVCRDDPHQLPQDMWRSQISIKPGYLISSAPRIQGVPGLGWTPRSPVPAPVQTSQGERVFYPYRSQDTWATEGEGRVTEAGLLLTWLVAFVGGKASSTGLLHWPIRTLGPGTIPSAMAWLTLFCRCCIRVGSQACRILPERSLAASRPSSWQRTGGEHCAALREWRN